MNKKQIEKLKKVNAHLYEALDLVDEVWEDTGYGTEDSRTAAECGDLINIVIRKIEWSFDRKKKKKYSKRLGRK